LLAKQHHPDVNPGSAEASTRTQAINAAYAMLSEPERRRAYDHELAAKKKPAARTAKIKQNISQDVHLRIQDFLRGTSLEVWVKDPANPAGPETYPLNIPAETPPGARFRVPRSSSNEGGFVLVRVRARPDFRFKVRGSDLRCDLRISSQRATQGGTEMVAGTNGTKLRLQIPPRVASGEIIRIPGEGLPKTRGGRGDLLVRILYRPDVRISHARER
jgi:DnaJ-class molecular chaperone